MTHHVYRVYDEGGSTLYVGATSNIDQRIEHHLVTAPWSGDLAEVDLTEHNSSEEARRVEAEEITRLRPRWNINGRGHRSTWQLSDYAEVILAVYARRSSGTKPPYYDVASGDAKIARLLAELERRFGQAGRDLADDLRPHVPAQAVAS